MDLAAIGMSQADYDTYRPVMDAMGGESVSTNRDISSRIQLTSTSRPIQTRALSRSTTLALR